MLYRHRFRDGQSPDWPVGKVVCVGRNYADHASELNNPVPEQPLLFIKPASAVIPFAGKLVIPRRVENPHYETEMTLLIDRNLSCCDESEALSGIAGLGIGLDLTLRALQSELKAKGHPWERAKAFDGSCVLSSFVPYLPGIDLQGLDIRLWRNSRCVQDGNTRQMLFPVLPLLCEISRVFSLQAGDVVMTGTPKGVGPLENGDRLVAELDDLVSESCTVVFQ